MSDDESPRETHGGWSGFWRAVWRRITLRGDLEADRQIRAGDRIFTTTPEGIRAAFRMGRDQKVKAVRDMRKATANLQALAEQDKLRLEEMNKEEKDEIAMRDGAVVEGEKATDPVRLTKLEAAYKRHAARITEIEAEQAETEIRLKETEDEVNEYIIVLQEFGAEIEELEREEERQVAKHVMAKNRISIHDQLHGIKTSFDAGPLDAVRKANARLTAEANIVRKLDGADHTTLDKELARAGRASVGGNDFQRLIAARKADRAATTGGSTTAPVDEKERGKIG